MSSESSNSISTPKHVAIIMDGNGRWATQQGLPRAEGHRRGVESVRRVIRKAISLNIEYVTLYAFSSENWNRPKEEVNALMSLFAEFLLKEQELFIKEGVRLKAIGDRSKLPDHVVDRLVETETVTADGAKVTLVLAVSYGGRDEIVRSVKKIITKIGDKELNPLQIDEKTISENLDTSEIPDPDLLIRTSGESRISNFLLWQLAYTEIVVSKVLWPDFTGDHLLECLDEYSSRERRYGK